MLPELTNSLKRCVKLMKTMPWWLQGKAVMSPLSRNQNSVENRRIREETKPHENYLQSGSRE